MAKRDDGFPVTVTFRGEVFDTPSWEQIEEWTVDSICESLQGDTVEPDGYDEEGYPSWLIALGLI